LEGVRPITVRKLIESLTLLKQNNPGEITPDSEVVVGVGVFRGALRRRLEAENSSGVSIQTFLEGAPEVTAGDGLAGEDNWAVVNPGRTRT
jgi:hypothetical protein